MAFKFWNAPAPPGLGYALHDYVGAVQESGAAMSTGPALLAEIMRQNRELRAKQEMQASEQGFEAQKQRDYLAGLLAHAQYTQGQEAERQKSEQEFRAKESTKQDDAMLRREKAQEAGQTFREMFRQSAETGRALQSQKAMDERQAAMQSAYMDRLDKSEEGRDRRAQMRSTTDLAQTGLQVFNRALGSGRSGSSQGARSDRYGQGLSALDAANLRLKAREQAAKELGGAGGDVSKVDPKALDDREEAIYRRSAGLPPPDKEPVNLDEVKATVQGMAAQGKSDEEIQKYLESKGYSLDHPLPDSAQPQAPQTPVQPVAPVGAQQGPQAPRMSLYDAAREAGPMQFPLPPSPDDPMQPDFAAGGGGGMDAGGVFAPQEPSIEDLLPLMGMNLNQLNALSEAAQFAKLRSARKAYAQRSIYERAGVQRPDPLDPFRALKSP